MVSRAEIGTHDIKATVGSAADASELASLHPDLIIVDGYQFSVDFYTQLEQSRLRHAVLDDNVETTALNPTFVINQNPHAKPLMYARFKHSQLLLGLQYAMIREQVRLAHSAPINRASNLPKVLISIGGSDSKRLTLPLMSEMRYLKVDLRVAIGPSNDHGVAIRSEAKSAAHTTVIDAEHYTAELAGSTCAVLGAGGTVWEAAYLGVPSIALVVADNQAEPARSAELQGFTHVIDGRTTDPVVAASRALADMLDDPVRRTAMTDAGSRAIDGRGVQRLADALTKSDRRRTVRG
jgi:UDP-2,4-diacetamido-2,4,6-trideoxy-beta-L-altropyranose hydrolase